MAATVNRVFLFGGPSLYCQNGECIALPPSFHTFPPARRGNIAYVQQHYPPATLVLIDGTFHHTLAVGHAELRNALRAGWQIWGLSSLGAIRAWEMRGLGMRGYGQVYARFAQEEDFQDDEVALLHSSDPPYRPISEPLIHLREALDCWQRQEWISAHTTTHILTDLKSRWYGDRTLKRLWDAILQATAPDLHKNIVEALRSFDRFRVKLHDVRQFIHAWETGVLD